MAEPPRRTDGSSRQARRASAAAGSTAGRVPGGVRAARALLGLVSAAWLPLGALLVAGGVIALAGGGGLAGVVSTEPGFAGVVGGLAIGAGLVALALGGFGLWTTIALAELSPWSRRGALILGTAGDTIGVAWLLAATTPIPGALAVGAYTGVILCLVAPASSRRAFRSGPLPSPAGAVDAG